MRSKRCSFLSWGVMIALVHRDSVWRLASLNRIAMLRSLSTFLEGSNAKIRECFALESAIAAVW